MSKPSINPRCPVCKVRHKAVDQWKCEEREERPEVSDAE